MQQWSWVLRLPGPQPGLPARAWLERVLLQGR
ncbi:hypothetical protein CSOJ01_10258 [Colletotrichum sojae]|uniref:Uncharacterized protein n=1 Tax=Colletotrichum sojae TaxID=2175907 RepID=A0A8H6J0U8_9PEZI|nr:hypothetical protein CSOJ01_10258 [Colletotrichum sojae]